MKIWHLTRSLSGGAGLYALRLSQALCAEGLESAVLVAEGMVLEGVVHLRRVDSPVCRIAARVLRSLSHRIALGPFHSLRGPEVYEAPHPIQAGDVVHLHGMTGWIGSAGLRRMIPQGAKVYWTAHDLWMLSGGCVVYQGCDRFRAECVSCPILKTPWQRLATQELRWKQAFIRDYQIQPIANSRWMAERIRESRLFGGINDIPVIPPIVDAAYLAENIPDLRRELGIPAGRKVICLGARSLDDKFKGIPEFLTHLSQAADLAGQLTVLLFGPGTIEIPANLDVRLLGSITSPFELAKIYRTSDVFVSPSLMETFGMTLMEAQACGTPVVAFDVGGIRDAVHPESHRWLEPTDRLVNLVALLNQRLQFISIAGNSSINPREWARACFGTTVVALHQQEMYPNAAGNGLPESAAGFEPPLSSHVSCQ